MNKAFLEFFQLEAFPRTRRTERGKGKVDCLFSIRGGSLSAHSRAPQISAGFFLSLFVKAAAPGII